MGPIFAGGARWVPPPCAAYVCTYLNKTENHFSPYPRSQSTIKAQNAQKCLINCGESLQ
jgi:hypothetical protein